MGRSYLMYKERVETRSSWLPFLDIKYAFDFFTDGDVKVQEALRKTKVIAKL